jgi:hypothetical protein
MTNNLPEGAVLDWLKEENAVYLEDNVYYAEKAFVVNSIIQWCIKQKNKKQLTGKQIDKYFRSLVHFLRGTLDLWWEDDIIKVRTIKKSTNEKSE